MDSLSQAALGAAVGIAVMGRRTAVWKSALWGAAGGTLPDLDALIDHGDPVSNMTLHRAESHALFWLTLAAAPIAAGIARLHGEWAQWRRWWLAMWMVLITHPLLDATTVYGTQLLLPFTHLPLGLGSMFIIDPLYTLPLAAGVVVALRRRGDAAGLAWNRAGLLLSCAYLAWSAVAQAWVRGDVERALQAQGLAPQRLLVTPAPFNTLLWRIVAVTPDGRYHEGFRSLLDGDRPLQVDSFDQGQALLERFGDQWAVQRMVWFTRGFYKLERDDGGVVVTDLRMGQEPGYVFAFFVPEARTAGAGSSVGSGGSGSADAQGLPRSVGGRLDLGRGLRWLGPRMLGADVPPPR